VIAWKQQGEAVVGALRFPDGRSARMVLVGPRDHPKGAMVVVATASEAADVMPLSQAVPLLAAQQIIEALCMQERVFGDSALDPPEFAS
jgi:hypothetical protein